MTYNIGLVFALICYQMMLSSHIEASS